jgi:ATP-dependent Clp protease ATP-binding subunit ClpA
LNWNVLNFKNSIVILTSNIGSENVNKKKIWFLQDEDEIDNSYSSEEWIFIDAIKEYLRPEIFNRISETYIFKPLSKKIIKKIFLNKINKNIEYFQNNELIHMMFKDKINSLNPSNIFEYTNNKYDLWDIENIRKVEWDIENIILRYLESK